MRRRRLLTRDLVYRVASECHLLPAVAREVMTRTLDVVAADLERLAGDVKHDAELSLAVRVVLARLSYAAERVASDQPS